MFAMLGIFHFFSPLSPIKVIVSLCSNTSMCVNFLLCCVSIVLLFFYSFFI